MDVLYMKGLFHVGSSFSSRLSWEVRGAVASAKEATEKLVRVMTSLRQVQPGAGMHVSVTAILALRTYEPRSK